MTIEDVNRRSGELTFDGYDIRMEAAWRIATAYAKYFGEMDSFLFDNRQSK